MRSLDVARDDIIKADEILTTTLRFAQDDILLARDDISDCNKKRLSENIFQGKPLNSKCIDN